MSGFEGKVAIVTGGGSGLGEAIGMALAAKGAKVVLSDIPGLHRDSAAGESAR
jgi:NAD(P)-dependent dehydrogenase (short-subunit alcohol dehydrogenase family)